MPDSPIATPPTAAALTLAEKIRSKRAHVGVVGLGYVGLPLAVEFARAGFHRDRLDPVERVLEHK